MVVKNKGFTRVCSLVRFEKLWPNLLQQPKSGHAMLPKVQQNDHKQGFSVCVPQKYKYKV